MPRPTPFFSPNKTSLRCHVAPKPGGKIARLFRARVPGQAWHRGGRDGPAGSPPGITSLPCMPLEALFSVSLSTLSLHDHSWSVTNGRGTVAPCSDCLRRPADNRPLQSRSPLNEKLTGDTPRCLRPWNGQRHPGSPHRDVPSTGQWEHRISGGLVTESWQERRQTQRNSRTGH